MCLINRPPACLTVHMLEDTALVVCTAVRRKPSQRKKVLNKKDLWHKKNIISHYLGGALGGAKGQFYF